MKNIDFILAIWANVIAFYHRHLNGISTVGRLRSYLHVIDIAVNREDIEAGSWVNEGRGLLIKLHIMKPVDVQLEAWLIVSGYENSCHVFLFSWLLKIGVIAIDIWFILIID